MSSIPDQSVTGPQAGRIAGIERHPRHLSLTWEDGRQERFHYIWLRDNCGCSACGDRAGGHRYLELGSIDPDIVPANIEIDSDGGLRIDWREEDHVTRYTSEWLRAHAYSPTAVAARQPKPVTWDSALQGNYPVWDYAEILADDERRRLMFEQIAVYGFAILDNVPAENEQIERLAAVFGFVRETHYGRVFELISTPEQRILAQTAHAIRPHNDELFRDPIPGLFMMHCLKASECGGGASLFVDGFRAAEILRQENPDQFELLCQVPIPHQRFLVDEVDDVALAAKWPTIELNPAGDIVAVHINERTLAPFDVADELVEPVYRALQAMLALVYRPEARIAHRLEAGQAAILDNHRVLHARDAFNGNRHIRQCHVDRDEFFSRLRALYRRADSSAQFLEFV